MANIHRLGDYNRERDNGNQNGLMERLNQAPIQDHLRVAEQHRVLFISGRKQIKNPSQQNYWDMLTYALCPAFKFISLTFLICVLDIVMFSIQASVGLDNSKNSQLLQINAYTLIKYGGNYKPDVLNGEVYRLVSAMFLHVHFMHIFGNLITTFMFLSRIEHTFGFVRTLVIYLVSGICGNIFSLVCSPEGVKAGASTALYGVIGIIFGYIVINWKGLDLVGPAMKCQIWCSAAMIIFFILIFTPTGASNIDFYGHLGGFLAGVWLSAIHTTIIDSKRERVIRTVFAMLLFTQILACFLVFYLTSP